MPHDSNSRRSIPPEELAKRARLQYVSTDEPGIVRVGCGTGFTYRHPSGRVVRGRRQRERIDHLAIPPAWTDVWICRDHNGHLQATGRDDRDRKQYLYHERWRDATTRAKFEGLAEFGRLLPDVRERVRRDLRRRALSKQKVAALIVELLDRTAVRVGNVEYARDNESYGLTTLRDRHAHVDGSLIVFRFRSKGGKKQHVQLRDARLANFVQRCRDVRGPMLFQYESGAGSRAITSDDVNEYLHEVAEVPFTAKTFRSWRASTLVVEHLAQSQDASSPRTRKRTANTGIRRAAEILGNTTTICRRYYVHPVVVDAYVEENWSPEPPSEEAAAKTGLSRHELALLDLLESAEPS